MIWYAEPDAIAQLTDAQLAAAVRDTTTETNRCRAEFVRIPSRENSIAWTNAMGQWLALSTHLDCRESGLTVRQLRLQATAVQRIRL